MAQGPVDESVVVRADRLGSSLCVRFRAETPPALAGAANSAPPEVEARPSEAKRDDATQLASRLAPPCEPKPCEPKPCPPVLPAESKPCPACRGRHRAHTCGRGLNKARATAQPRFAGDGSQKAAAPLAQLESKQPGRRAHLRRTVPTAAMLAAKTNPERGLRVFTRISPKSWLPGVIDKMLSNGIVRIAYDDGTAAVTQWDPTKNIHVVEPAELREASVDESPTKKRRTEPSDASDAMTSTDEEDELDENPGPGRTPFLARLVIGPREDIALKAILDLACSRHA